MNTLKKCIAVTAVAFGIALPVHSFAQMAMEPGKMQASPPMSMTDGEIKKIDPEAGKVTIKHGDIKHLDMPGMTMVFTAKDKSMLSSLKAGDMVKFMVVSENGKMVLTDIQPSR